MNRALGYRTVFVLSLLVGLVGSGIGPSVASASFGLNNFDFAFTEADGSPAVTAGSHPYAMTTRFDVNTRIDPLFGEVPDGEIKNFSFVGPMGLAGSPMATPRCSEEDFHGHSEGNNETETFSECPDSTAVGTASLVLNNGSSSTNFGVPISNLVPLPGEVARLGFIAIAVPVTIDIHVSEDPPYRLIATTENVSQARQLVSSEITLWGNPSDPAHDPVRGNCVAVGESGTPVPGTNIRSRGSCPFDAPKRAFLTLPTACLGPLSVNYRAESWEGTVDQGGLLTHDNSVPPQALGLEGCDRVPFSPTASIRPTGAAASSPTGLETGLDISDPGLLDPGRNAQSSIRKAEIVLPPGLTTNASIADGLGSCSEAQLAKETASSPPGAGCPNSSKVGTVSVETPLVEEVLTGSLYVAQPYQNPFHSLLAAYMVIKSPTLGIAIKQPVRVETDPDTGRLTAIAEELPQLPFSHFRLHLREGSRSVLASPASCGSYDAFARMTPWSGGALVTSTSTFEIVTGPTGSGCPSGSLPFHPDLVAGTVNNAAASYSPFDLRLSRADGEQALKSFSIEMPPGLLGRLKGVQRCSDAAIQAAGAKTGSEEEEHPSCPADSSLGHTLAGAGVGSSLTYVPGSLYLGGPYRGAPLSIVAITPAKVGPFDLGTVVIREPLRIEPETGRVRVEATDAIPRILQGIPVQARDVRISVDRPRFTLNPTSCAREVVMATVNGYEDGVAAPTVPFQAADCASLAFSPKLRLRLAGGTHRGANPKLRAVVSMPQEGGANIAKAQVTLPHSEFLEQGHIRTICTRVQFNQGAVPGEGCPKGAVYGWAKAITPLLGEPLEGPVFLRSSNHPLPDMVAALHGEGVSITVVGRIDSGKGGRIRSTFESVPDAPVSKFILEMQGGKKGLLVNSRNLCQAKAHATATFTGQNGKLHQEKPFVVAHCPRRSGRLR